MDLHIWSPKPASTSILFTVYFTKFFGSPTFDRKINSLTIARLSLSQYITTSLPILRDPNGANTVCNKSPIRANNTECPWASPVLSTSVFNSLQQPHYRRSNLIRSL